LRPLWLLAVLGLVALISACGSNASAGTGTAASSGPLTTTPTSLDHAVKFSQCMRDNGVKQFPDPNASGQLTIDGVVNGSGLNPNSEAFQQALTACKALEPPGFAGTTRTPQQQEVALKFAQCIRDNGVSDFPDPTPDGPLVDTTRIPSSSLPGGMSALHAAMHTCGAIYGAELGVRSQ
jgi:hypothetical protein